LSEPVIFTREDFAAGRNRDHSQCNGTCGRSWRDVDLIEFAEEREEFAVTCTPAFGSNDGLVECLDANEYDTGDADFSLYNCSL
jgi:hypothetical protein